MCVCAAVPASRGAVPQRLASVAASQVLRNQPRPCISFLGRETERVEGLTGVKPLIFLVARAELHRRPKKFQPFQFSTDADACFVLKSGRSKRRYDCHIRVGPGPSAPSAAGHKLSFGRRTDPAAFGTIAAGSVLPARRYSGQPSLVIFSTAVATRGACDQLRFTLWPRCPALPLWWQPNRAGALLPRSKAGQATLCVCQNGQ